MPVRRTKTSKGLDKEFTSRGAMALLDDDYRMLSARVEMLETRYGWSEHPPSRMRHQIANVRIVSRDGDTLCVRANFHFDRTRLNSEEDNRIGIGRTSCAVWTGS